MKNTKTMLTAIIAVAALYNSQTAQAAEFFNAPAVEIYNKSNQSIIAFITNLDNQVVHAIGIPKETAARYDADINSKLRFEIWSPSNTKHSLAVVSIDAPGKTKYLSWDPTKTTSLYPQTGPMYGLLGKTKSRLSLKKNISSSQIKTEPTQYSMSNVPVRQISKPAGK